MKKITFYTLLSVSVLISFTAYSQVSIHKTKSYGGSDYDIITKIIPVLGNKYLTAGTTYSMDGDAKTNHGKSDVWLMLLDSDYNKIWSICYGGSGDENLSEISFSKNNDIVFVANSNSSDGDITQPLGNTDVWLVKLDTNGTILQQKSIGSPEYDCAFWSSFNSSGEILIRMFADSKNFVLYPNCVDCVGLIYIDSIFTITKFDFGNTYPDYPYYGYVNGLNDTTKFIEVEASVSWWDQPYVYEGRMQNKTSQHYYSRIEFGPEYSSNSISKINNFGYLYSGAKGDIIGQYPYGDWWIENRASAAMVNDSNVLKWERKFGKFGQAQFNSAVNDSLNNIYHVGYNEDYSWSMNDSAFGTMLFSKLNSLGQLQFAYNLSCGKDMGSLQNIACNDYCDGFSVVGMCPLGFTGYGNTQGFSNGFVGEIPNFNKRIEGRCYIDLNSNSIFDSLDTPIAYEQVILNHYETITDSLGNYFFEINDSCTAKIMCKFQNLFFVSNPTERIVQVPLGVFNSTNNDFAYQPNTLQAKSNVAVTVHSLQLKWVPSYQNSLEINISNKGNSTENCNLKLWNPITNHSNLFSSNLPPDSTFADTLYWQISNVNIFQTKKLLMSFQSSNLLNINDTVVFAAFLSSSNIDIDTMDNSDVSYIKAENPANINSGIDVDKDTIWTNSNMNMPYLEYSLYYNNYYSQKKDNDIRIDLGKEFYDNSTFELKDGSNKCVAKYNADSSVIYLHFPEHDTIFNSNYYLTNRYVSYRVKLKYKIPANVPYGIAHTAQLGGQILDDNTIISEKTFLVPSCTFYSSTQYNQYDTICNGGGGYQLIHDNWALGKFATTAWYNDSCNGSFITNTSNYWLNLTATKTFAETITDSVCGVDTCLLKTIIVMPSVTVAIVAANSGFICNDSIEVHLNASAPGTFAWYINGNLIDTTHTSLYIKNQCKLRLDYYLVGGCTLVSYKDIYLSKIGLQLGDDGPRCGGVINAITNNGTSFLWNNGAATQSIVATQPGQYNITVTNSAGCIAHDTVSISIVTPPVFNLGNDTASCSTIEIKGPVGMQNYFWNVDDWLTQTDTSSFYFYGIGQVSLTVIDSNGCIARDSLNISAYQPIVDFDSTKKGCNYVNLQSNNFYNATYLWSDGSTLSYLNADTSGLYTCTATAAGCISTDSCYVTVFYLQNFNLGKDTILCHQNSYTLNCSIPNMKYKWYKYNTILPDTTASINVTETAKYALQIQSPDTCYAYDEIYVTFSNIDISLLNDTVDCNIHLKSSYPYGSFLWSNGSTNDSILVTSPANYELYFTDYNGCKDTAEILIPQSIYTSFNIGNDTTVCAGIPVNLISSNAYNNYLWSNGSTVNSITINTDGTYWLQVSNDTVCSKTDSIIVSFENFILNLGNDTSSCGNLLLIPNVPGNSYLWSNGSTNNTIVADTTGTYILNMISTNGCTYNDSINVVIHPLPFIQFNPGINDTLCKNAGIINFSSGVPLGGTYSIDQTTLAQNQLNTLPLSFGMHQLKYTVIDTNLCENEIVFNLFIDACAYIKDNNTIINSAIYKENNDELQIQLTGNKNDMQIYNALGACIYTSNLISNSININFQKFAAGVYILIVSSEKGRSILKLNIMKD